MRTRDSTSTHSGKRSQKRELKIGGKRISDVTRTDLVKTSIDLSAAIAVLVDMFNVTLHMRWQIMSNAILIGFLQINA
jgi:hypothetical protein